MNPVLADIVWPALVLEERLFSWWAIGAGLLVEFFFCCWLTKLDPRRCVVATSVMNDVSALLGVLLIPVAGVVWEIFPGMIVYKVFNIGIRSPGR